MLKYTILKIIHIQTSPEDVGAAPTPIFACKYPQIYSWFSCIWVLIYISMYMIMYWYRYIVVPLYCQYITSCPMFELDQAACPDWRVAWVVNGHVSGPHWPTRANYMKPQRTIPSRYGQEFCFMTQIQTGIARLDYL